jgi:hypothetical protein
MLSFFLFIIFLVGCDNHFCQVISFYISNHPDGAGNGDRLIVGNFRMKTRADLLTQAQQEWIDLQEFLRRQL